MYVGVFCCYLIYIYIIVDKDIISFGKNLEKEYWNGGYVIIDKSNNKFNIELVFII